jgi:spore maturation protein SpmB
MFYVLAVYFGSVGVRRTRYAVSFALLADVVGSISGIIAAYIFFK